jgi:hypothetical protein
MEQTPQNIEHNFNEPQVLRKLHSGFEIVFTPDPDDSHFINIEMRRIKTGETKCSHYIIKSDASQWFAMYETDGWIQFKQ